MPVPDQTSDDGRLLDLLRRSFDQSEAVIRSVEPGQMASPTPCGLFDVRTLVGHMLFAAERVGAAGRRDPLSEEGPAVSGLDDGEWAPSFAKAAAAAMEAWGAQGATAGDIELPFGTFPATVVAQIYVIEQVTHAWDLAVAVGARTHLDADLAASVLPMAHEVIRPEYRGEEPMPFAAEVAAGRAAGAPDRLAAFMGRDAGAWPA